MPLSGGCNRRVAQANNVIAIDDLPTCQNKQCATGIGARLHHGRIPKNRILGQFHLVAVADHRETVKRAMFQKP